MGMGEGRPPAPLQGAEGGVRARGEGRAGSLLYCPPAASSQDSEADL